MSGLRIKQAMLADLDELARLFNEYRNFYSLESDIDGARKFLSARMDREESIVYLAMDEATGEAIGFAQLYPSFSSLSMKRIWILNDLFVTTEHRKRGAAQALLNATEQLAIQTGAKAIELCTGIENEVAQRLYANNGYVKDELFFHYSRSV